MGDTKPDRQVWSETSGVRPAAVAGRFYPAEPSRLRKEVSGCLQAAGPYSGEPPKAVIAPHAGFRYSGPIAGSAYAALATNKGVNRVVVFGPSHYVGFAGFGLSGARAFSTPFGPVPVEEDVETRLKSLPQIRTLPPAHVPEHSLEVQLPFLQQVFSTFISVPILVGQARDQEVQHVIEALWDGPETVFVISSDLSHYLDYESACQLDRETATAIEELKPEDIGDDQACGRIPVRGLLCAARERGMRVKTLDLRNSGDTSGARDRVVGYGAFAFY